MRSSTWLRIVLSLIPALVLLLQFIFPLPVQANSWPPQFLYKIPNQPSFVFPRGVAIAPDGSIWVADTGNNQIVKFDPVNPGQELRIGASGSGDGQFNNPTGLAVDSSGNIYVAGT